MNAIMLFYSERNSEGNKACGWSLLLAGSHPGVLIQQQGQRMELGLLRATDGGNAGRGPPGQDWSTAGKRPGNGGKKYSFPVLESREAPQGEGV